MSQSQSYELSASMSLGANDRHDVATTHARVFAWLREKGYGVTGLILVVVFDVFVIAMALLMGIALRILDPDVFTWGQHLLNLERGILLSALLSIGGGALLGAVFLSVRRRLHIAATFVALLSGLAFLVFLGIDIEHKIYRRLLPGDSFRANERYIAYRFGVRLPRDWKASSLFNRDSEMESESMAAVPQVRKIDAGNGRALFLRVCASCHGPQGEGLPGSGKPLKSSEFIRERSDEALVEFLKVGRQPWDPENTTGVQMPGRGGDPRITDDDLRDIVAYLRELQKDSLLSSGESDTQSNTEKSPDRVDDAAASLPSATGTGPDELVVERSYIPDIPSGPKGLSLEYLAELSRPEWAIPERAGGFWGVYFTLTGLAVLHVLLALLLVMCGLYAVLRRRSERHVQPILVLASTGWLWATGCWFMMFGLLYLCP